MRQPLSSLTRWVAASVLAGLAIGANADTPVARRINFLEVNGDFMEFGIGGGPPLGINNAGQIVGGTPQGSGYLFDPAVGVTTIDVPGARDTKLTGVNDAGQIVGSYVPAPIVPEPRSLVLFSVGLLGVGLAWWRGEGRRHCQCVATDRKQKLLRASGDVRAFNSWRLP